jgi:hypothetical protein
MLRNWSIRSAIFLASLFSFPVIFSLSVLEGYAGELKVDFNDGTRGPLELFYGPTDNPADRNEAFTVKIENGQAVFVAPAANPGPRLTGFLEPPRNNYPMKGNLTIAWTFTKVSELLALGKGSGPGMAIAGYYVRGEYNFQARQGHWAGGQFGDYWFGYAYEGGQALSVIRQGRDNLQTETFTAKEQVSYRIEKTGAMLRLFANYDNQGWHQVGKEIQIRLNPGGSDAVAMSHLRVLDTSGAAIRVTADDFVWSGEALK